MTIPIYIKKDARDRLWSYILTYHDCEIGGFGFATIDAENRFVWWETFLVDQTASPGHIDFTDKGIVQAIDRATESGFLDDPYGIWVWWHSHHSMSAYWSNTDEGGVEALRETGVPYMLSFVGNTKMEHKVRLDVFDVPLLGHATEEDCILRRYPSEPYQEEIEQDIRDYVKRENPTKAGGGTTRTTGGTSTTSQSQLPPGTRPSDPGDKLADALAERAGYAEYTRDELDGKSTNEVLAELGFDVDDEGDIFNWRDVLDCLGSGPDADVAAKSAGDEGFACRKYNGDWYVFVDIEYIEAANGEIVEVQTADEYLAERANELVQEAIEEQEAAA